METIPREIQRKVYLRSLKDWGSSNVFNIGVINGCAYVYDVMKYWPHLVYFTVIGFKVIALNSLKDSS